MKWLRRYRPAQTHAMAVFVALSSGGLAACDTTKSEITTAPETPHAPADATPTPRLPAPEVDNTAAFDRGMAPVLEAYLAIQQSLAGDQLTGINDAGAKMVGVAASIDSTGLSGKDAEIYRTMPKEIARLGGELSRATTLEAARAQLGALSISMSAWIAGARPVGVDMAFCPMVQLGWFQKKGAIDNPYHGLSMRTCGSVVSSGP